MWNLVNQVLTTIDNFVWGVPLMVLIIAGGILLTVRLGVLQIRKLPLALKWMIKNEEEGEGEISSFAALCTALSATIGTGNIVGVATAVCAGGPGALFWMIVAAFFGMATKYSEGLLAVKYRVVSEDGIAVTRSSTNLFFITYILLYSFYVCQTATTLFYQFSS